METGNVLYGRTGNAFYGRNGPLCPMCLKPVLPGDAKDFGGPGGVAHASCTAHIHAQAQRQMNSPDFIQSQMEYNKRQAQLIELRNTRKNLPKFNFWNFIRGKK